jgi:hypothetical protein
MARVDKVQEERETERVLKDSQYHELAKKQEKIARGADDASRM